MGGQERRVDIFLLPLANSGTCWSLLFSLPFTCSELCVPHVFVCLLVMHSIFSGFGASWCVGGPLRVCEGLFSLLPSLSGKRRASFIPQRRSELLDPVAPCYCAPFCSPLHLSPSLPACSEFLVGLCRDLDSIPDLNI